MSKYADIIKRLEEADGPDRALDAHTPSVGAWSLSAPTTRACRALWQHQHEAGRRWRLSSKTFAIW